MSVFFRFDDIGSLSRTSLRFIELMESLERPYILAVIPSALSFWMRRPLRDTRYALIYQHGVDHQNRSTSTEQDELPAHLGRAYIQRRLISGRRRLADSLGREILGYVPPWNRISDIALRTIEDEGYTCISGHQPLDTSLIQLPVHIDVYSSYRPVTVRPIADIRADILAQRDAVCGVMLHPLSTPRRKLPELQSLIRECLPHALSSQAFDRILAHPPEVTSLASS